MTTLENDHTLPALPLPELEETCANLAALIAPLVSPDEMKNTKAALADLGKPGGDGEKLHQALLEYRAALPGNASWLRPFWDDMYTAWRDMLPVNMNYILRFDSDRWGGQNALPRLLRALSYLFRQATSGTLAPEATKGGYLSMDQLLSCAYTRIPGEPVDQLRPVALNGPHTVAVSCGGHWFILGLSDSAGNIASEQELQTALANIRKEAAALAASGVQAPAVSAFTSANREAACAARKELAQNELNRHNLSAIENSLFALCLDDAHSSDEDCARRILCGDAAGRWFDKSLQIIATANNGIGINLEHSGCDAGIWLYLFTKADELLTGKAEMTEAASGATTDSDSTACPPPSDSPVCASPQKNTFTVWQRKLGWAVPDVLAKTLATLRADFSAIENNVDICCRPFPEYSRGIAKELATSPDAFLQISFQAAQTRLYGKLRCAYEAVATRSFYQGRTEAGRPATAEAAEFAAALARKAPKEELREAYRKAEKAHLERLALCQKGRGPERHLHGLRQIWQMRGKELGIDALPAIFNDNGWKALKHDALSTSGIGGAFILYFGFGPVVADGIGAGYAPSAAFTSLTITAFRDKSPAADAFVIAFEEAASAIRTALKD
ncbi:choline/carnitine O-acyltransferase [Desulfovibrio sp. OttesenSCG-928-C06]|nr:choline/carnitine O-acyltransferase [Desulfovibrio sp. OttesenSCG-928-C06]